MKPSVTLATVAEIKGTMLLEAFWLFHSLRTFGGTLSGARAVLYVVDRMPAEIAPFNELGVEIKLVPTIDFRSPHCNKIHMLLEECETDWLVAMDTDTIITGDFRDQLERPVVSAKIVDGNPLSEELWGRMYGHFGLTLPPERFLTHFHAKESNPYFNSGVLLIPGRYRAVLGQAWLRMVPKIMAIYRREPEIAKHQFFTDQFAFALALTETSIAYRTLPLEMNFPTHKAVHPTFMPREISPLILHHHHKITPQGMLQHCEYPVVNELIDRFNLSLGSDNCVAFRDSL